MSQYVHEETYDNVIQMSNYLGKKSSTSLFLLGNRYEHFTISSDFQFGVKLLPTFASKALKRNENNHF